MLLLQFAHHLIEIVVQLEPVREKGMLTRMELEAGIPLLYSSDPTANLPTLNYKVFPISFALSVQGPVPPSLLP